MTIIPKTIGYAIIHWADDLGQPQSAAGELVEVTGGWAKLDWGFAVDVTAKDFRMEPRYD